MSYYDLTKQAGELRKAKNYSEALPLYKEALDDYPDECGEYDWWGYSQCLLKLDIYPEALKFSREGLLKFPESAYLKTVYTWSLYHVRIKPEPVNDRDAFFKSANAIVKLTTADDKYCPFVITVFSVIDLLEMDYDQNVHQILEWINKLKPEQLSKTSFAFTNGEGKHIENASDFEKYHAILTKAQQETGQFHACIATATSAYEQIAKFHHGNEVWIRRQRALANFHLKNYSESLTDYQQVLSQKQDWFLKKELAELYLAMGETDKALVAAMDAADDPGVSKMKVKLFVLIAQLFLTLGRHSEALLHARLANAMREQEGWSDDAEADEIISQCSMVDNLPDDLPSLRKLAAKVWTDNLPQDTRLTGTISNILPKGNAGFIKGDDGADFYFQTRDINDRRMTPAIGVKVSFVKTVSFDPVRNKPSLKATDIRQA